MSDGQAALWADPHRKRRIGRARRGFDKTKSALAESGRLEPVDEALVVLNRLVFDMLDECMADPEASWFTRRAVLAEARVSLLSLLDRDTIDDLDDDLAALLAAPMGNTPEP